MRPMLTDEPMDSLSDDPGERYVAFRGNCVQCGVVAFFLGLGHPDEGYNFCPVHGVSLADSEVPAHVRSAFPSFYPYQPNIGRYWPLLAAHSVYSTPGCWLPTAPANQPQGGKGGPSPLLCLSGGGRGFWGRACESKKGRIRAAFSRARIIYD